MAISRMSKSSQKLARQLAIDAEYSRRWRQAEAESPLSRTQLESLLDFLSEQLVTHGHDGDFAATGAWLRQQTLDPAPVRAFFAKLNIVDDYDAVLRADPHQLFGPTSTRLARMPLEKSALEALIDDVDVACRQEGCDHTLRHTLAWLTQRGLSCASTETALLAQGGGCDCEVVLNVDPSNIYPNPPQPPRSEHLPLQDV